MNNEKCKAFGNPSNYHWFSGDGMVIYHSYFDIKSNKIIEEECNNPCKLPSFNHYKSFDWDTSEYFFSHKKYVWAHEKVPEEERCFLNFECPTCEFIDEDFR